MPNTTNRVKLPYILQSQSQKEVTHNASLDLIDALLQAAMVSVGVNTPPGSPNAGDSYIVGSAPTGAWAGQAKFDDFVEVYNHQRPHQGIANHYPAELYTPSTKIYRGLPEVDYPFADKTVTITHCGRT